jgi:hypothetical protein
MNTIPTPASAKAQYTYTPDRKREQAIVKLRVPRTDLDRAPQTTGHAHCSPTLHYRRAHENPKDLQCGRWAKDLQCGRWDLINQPVGRVGLDRGSSASPYNPLAGGIISKCREPDIGGLVGSYHRAALGTNR